MGADDAILLSDRALGGSDTWATSNAVAAGIRKIGDYDMFEAYGERFRPSPQIIRLVDSGRLGRKTGAGFYDYEEKK